jgi:hypothetical protein
MTFNAPRASEPKVAVPTPNLRSESMQVAAAIYRATIRSTTARVVGGVLGFTCLALLLLSLITPRIELNGGLGDDGRFYAEITQGLRDHVAVAGRAPFAFRLLPSALVAPTPFDIPTGFSVLNVLSVLGSAVLIVVLLRRYGATAPATLLALSWWLAVPMGARWALYNPVLPDALGFFLLMLLVLICLDRRYVLLAVALLAGVLTRENLLMTVPFLWRAHVARGFVRISALTLIAALPAATMFFAVREFQALAAPGGEFFALRGIPNGLGLILDNWEGQASRYALAAPLSLGLLVWIPIVRYRNTLAFLRREVHWGYFLLLAIIFATIGGGDTDRYLYVLSPLALVLTFAVTRELWSSLLRSGLLTLLHFTAIRFGMPIGPVGDPAGYAIKGMDPTWLWAFAVAAGASFALAALVIRWHTKGDTIATMRGLLGKRLVDIDVG